MHTQPLSFALVSCPISTYELFPILFSLPYPAEECWEWLGGHLVSSQGQPTTPTCTSDAHISLENISAENILLFYFTLEVSPPVLYVWLYALQASGFQASVSLHLPHFSCWPLTVQVISASSISFFPLPFDFFMKVLSFIPSNSCQALTTVRNLQVTKTARECAERIAHINSIFMIISHILEKSRSTVVSTQVALSDSFCCYLCLIAVPASALVSFRL